MGLKRKHCALLVISSFVIVSALSMNATLASDDWVNVRDYGAKGSGRGDDAAAFRRALEHVPPRGGTLYVPSGRYRIGTSIQIARGNITVECGANANLIVAGRGVVLLHFQGGQAPGGQIQDVRVNGCTFIDPDPLNHIAMEESHGIIINNVERATLRDLHFDNLGDESIDIQRSSHVKVLDSYFTRGCSAVTHANAGALSSNNSSNVQLRGNTFVDNSNGSAIRVEITRQDSVANHIIVSDNQIYDPQDLGDFEGGSGIVVVTAQGTSTGLTITNNQIVNPFRSGIIVVPLGSEVRGVIVSNNLVSGGGHAPELAGSHRSAISIRRGATKAVVSGNIVDGWGFSAGASLPGMRVDAQRASVVANVVDEVPGLGLIFANDDGDGNVLVGNCMVDSLGVQAAGPNLIGLNKVDGTTDLTLPDLQSCASIGTDSDGRLACAP